MRVGVTGHQERRGIEWTWVKHAIRTELSNRADVQKALSSLAAGTDQVFAKAAMSLGIPVIAVLPLEGYERFFKGRSLAQYTALLRRCEPIQLIWKGHPEEAFLRAGKFIVENCDLLIAVWDGAAAKGLGGTADVVAFAKRKRRPIFHINPFTKSVLQI